MEDWFKFERIKVLQDSYGMAYQANFAIIDTIKWEDLGNYKYSFKHITTPLNKAMPKNGKDEVGWLIKKEEGFEPVKDIDLKSLRFGISEEVNFGRGSKALRIDEHAGGGGPSNFDFKAVQVKSYYISGLASSGKSMVYVL